MFSNFKKWVGQAFVLTWLLVISFSAAIGAAVILQYIAIGWLSLPLLLVFMAAHDSLQTKHTIRRNYPLAGRLRYLLESIRPEIRQYFFESESDGKPFSKRQRSLVYQRAKNVKDTVAFGMQDDPNRIGYEWVAHSVYPKKADPASMRVWVGSDLSKQPYHASLLNISAMSYGALSKTAIMALNGGAAMGGFAHNTGEGGISPYHLQGADLIWQIGTGYFGCRTDDGLFSPETFAQKANLPQVKMIEIKLSQGAKPGHGGLLPAHKNTPEIAAIRQLEPYTTVHSPSAHSTFSDPHGLILFIDQLRRLSGGKPIGIKLCVGLPSEFEEMVNLMAATGIYPDFITVDGAEGGTGAAPLEFMDHVGLTLNEALPFVSATLKYYGLREKVRVIASGKIISAFDMAKQLASGADLCYSARGMMFALGCIQALQCDKDSCPVGVATQNKRLANGLDVADKRVRVKNFHGNTLKALADLMGASGFEKPEEINPAQFFKRVGAQEINSFDKLNAQFQPSGQKYAFKNFTNN